MASVTGLKQQIVTQKAAQIPHNLGRRHRMETMAPKIAIDALQIETARVAAHSFLLFEHGDARDSLVRELIGRAYPSRSRAENHRVWLGRGHPFGTAPTLAGIATADPVLCWIE